MRRTITHEGVEYRRYDHLYSVSRDGKLLLQPTQGRRPRDAIGKAGPVVVRPSVRPDGYLVAGRSSRLVHRMVAICWLERPAGAKVVHHINHDKTDNRAENLQWVKHREHMSHHLGEVGRYVRTEATRQKLREYRLGTKQTAATKRKIGRAMRQLGIQPPSALGRVRPEEERAWMRENNWNNTPCVVRGVRYRSFSEAARAIGMKPHTLRKRCLSENSFPDFQVLYASMRTAKD
jgi:hypothetical protein